MNFNIDKHRISNKEVKYIASPNHRGKFKKGLPDSIVIHFTAGASFASSVQSLCDPVSKASAHVVIGRKGEVSQLIPFDTIAWHAGKSELNGRSGYNHYSIGIELDNAGLLQKQGEKFTSWFGRSYHESEVVKAKHRNESATKYWHAFTEMQINCCIELCKALLVTYNIKEIVGHEEISPGRKIDPGPAFPLDKVRRLLLEPFRRDENDDDHDGNGVVLAAKLNVRDKPAASGKQVNQLQKGLEVEILEEKEGWYKVRYKTEGWVFAKYIGKT